MPISLTINIYIHIDIYTQIYIIDDFHRCKAEQNVQLLIKNVTLYIILGEEIFSPPLSFLKLF